jgi:hypothetical protein
MPNEKDGLVNGGFVPRPGRSAIFRKCLLSREAVVRGLKFEISLPNGRSTAFTSHLSKTLE